MQYALCTLCSAMKGCKRVNAHVMCSLPTSSNKKKRKHDINCAPQTFQKGERLAQSGGRTLAEPGRRFERLQLKSSTRSPSIHRAGKEC